MRNCLFLKLLAILLCAASLLGIIGGAAGALVLAEGNLYKQTVDELIEQRAADYASEAANRIASRYGDQILGGCPSEISRYSRDYFLSNNYTTYGYAILDGEGTVLESMNPELKNSTQTHSIPMTGQYMHLVSLQTESQAMEEAVRKHMDAYSGAMADIDGNTVPAEGISINQVIFTGQDGHVLYEANCNGLTGSSTYFYRDYLLDNGTVDNFANTYHDHQSSKTGFLFYNADRQLAYTSFLEEHEKPFQAMVYGVYFFGGDHGFTYQLEDPEGIGTLSNESGYLLFTSFASALETRQADAAPMITAETIPEVTTVTVPEETVQETTAETAADTTEVAKAEEAGYAEAETIPAQSSAEETHYEERSEEADAPSSASAIPEEDRDHADASDAEAQADEPNNARTASDDEIAYYKYIEEESEKRILLEWLLANGLITEDDIPGEMIPDDIFREYLIHYELIRPEQAFPAVPPAEPEQEETTPAETLPEETIPEATEAVLINGKPLESYQINHTEYINGATGELTHARYVYLPMPELTVEIYAGPENMRDASGYAVLRVLQQYRRYLLPAVGICFVFFILSSVYLCTAAGRRPKTDEVRASGINKLPLDLYLCLGTGIGLGIAALAFGGAPMLLSRDFTLGCSLAAVSGFGCCLIFTGFCFAFVAQLKTGSGMWWRNTLSVRFIFLFMHFAEKFRVWAAEKGFPRLLGFVRKLWKLIWKVLTRVYAAVEKFTARTGAKLNRYFSLMPLTWQWVVSGMLLFCLILIACNTRSELLTFLCLAAAMALVFYGCHCFGVLLESTRKMGKGNLETKVEDKFMVGCFRDFANDLNDLGNVAAVAAQKQLKSERMKTELITNVSHDIKTPLTSIINYVDLLQKPHTQEQAEAYLEVLDRQSQRLKKLVDDLMDMSKASTGNMAVEITKMDMVEAVNQALGEFSDKLERAQLYPVFRHNEASVPILADGKLVWRVLSNVLSNAVKYAMPRTRIYLDLTHVHGQVILSLKNISREELNVTAEELMERFVRGDVSRNTEGSGLGLNIAKSLMELQKGQLQILVDGDLFKVTLIFPDAR